MVVDYPTPYPSPVVRTSTHGPQGGQRSPVPEPEARPERSHFKSLGGGAATVIWNVIAMQCNQCNVKRFNAMPCHIMSCV